MPTTINMIGTHYWGRTEPHPDGSYITTEWITIFVPIAPMKSLRLLPVGRKGSREEYAVLEELPDVHPKQVAHVYRGVAAFLLAVAAALVPLICIGFQQNNATGYIIFMVILCISYLAFTLWVDGFEKEASSASSASQPPQGVAVPVDAREPQPRVVRCPACGSTDFHVEEEAGISRCSNCHSILPNHVNKDR